MFNLNLVFFESILESVLRHERLCMKTYLFFISYFNYLLQVSCLLYFFPLAKRHEAFKTGKGILQVKTIIALSVSEVNERYLLYAVTCCQCKILYCLCSCLYQGLEFTKNINNSFQYLTVFIYTMATSKRSRPKLLSSCQNFMWILLKAEP